MMTREELQQVREDARRQIEAYDCRILVCSGTGCIATGSTKIYEEFPEAQLDNSLIPCLMSDNGPVKGIV